MSHRPAVRPAAVACETIAGVFSIGLESNHDRRGELVEIFRASWLPANPPLQWNLLRSEPGVLRGVHVHVRHTDYVACLHGQTVVGLKDLRRSSPTYLKEARYELQPRVPRLVQIPPGVAHGFHFPVESLLMVAVTRYFDPKDDLGYRWDDPAALLFPEVRRPILSDRDRRAPPFVDLLARLAPHQSDLSV